MASCYLSHAQNTQDEAEQIANLELAHFWDHRVPGFTGLAHPIAERYFEQGNDALADEDWEKAYADYSQALQLSSKNLGKAICRRCRDKVRIVRPIKKATNLTGKTEAEVAHQKTRKENHPEAGRLV